MTLTTELTESTESKDRFTEKCFGDIILYTLYTFVCHQVLKTRYFDLVCSLKSQPYLLILCSDLKVYSFIGAQGFCFCFVFSDTSP